MVWLHETSETGSTVTMQAEKSGETMHENFVS